jgi:hypothetical protein
VDKEQVERLLDILERLLEALEEIANHLADMRDNR